MIKVSNRSLTVGVGSGVGFKTRAKSVDTSRTVKKQKKNGDISRAKSYRASTFVSKKSRF